MSTPSSESASQSPFARYRPPSAARRGSVSRCRYSAHAPPRAAGRARAENQPSTDLLLRPGSRGAEPPRRSARRGNFCLSAARASAMKARSTHDLIVACRERCCSCCGSYNCGVADKKTRRKAMSKSKRVWCQPTSTTPAWTDNASRTPPTSRKTAKRRPHRTRPCLSNPRRPTARCRQQRRASLIRKSCYLSVVLSA